MDLWSRSAREAHPFIPGEGEGTRAEELRSVYLVDAENWVAVLDGRVVGLLGLLDSEIGGLFVHPDHQGKGIGRALVDHARSLRGAVHLEVYAENERARGFYTHLGFTDRGRRRVEEATGATLIHLVLE